MPRLDGGEDLRQDGVDLLRRAALHAQPIRARAWRLLTGTGDAHHPHVEALGAHPLDATQQQVPSVNRVAHAPDEQQGARVRPPRDVDRRRTAWRQEQRFRLRVEDGTRQADRGIPRAGRHPA